ncbi:MAG: hypothetical protein JRF58_09945 [Deltaproteobacteria bacterium]|nr:hypothetical protein [Deltaproteobacteria bacterium]
MLHIVFICTGNICRSPMAEGLMRHKWREMGRNGMIFRQPNMLKKSVKKTVLIFHHTGRDLWWERSCKRQT